MSSNGAQSLSVVMYHYVREIGVGDFPDIKGLTVEKFKSQIDYLAKNYSIISMEEAIDALYRGGALPDNSALLTFDDGYIDHYENVLPILKSRGLNGAFYPPVKAVQNRKLLDVNKVHLILAATNSQEKKSVYESLVWRVRALSEKYMLKSIDEYVDKYAVASMYDNKNVMFIKRMLQFALPSAARQEIIPDLLEEFTGKEEEELSNELYMTPKHLMELVDEGMHVGGHGAMHQWLSKLSEGEQEQEIVESKKMLLEIGADSDYLTFCYPYGDSNATTQALLKDHKFKLAFTTVPTIASFEVSNAFSLERLDTNQIPHLAV